jgi:predicted nucleic acid-binding Zn ribbon protein
MSAEPLVNCPSCHQATYIKLVSAAGFQLKGSGWYATDFKDKGSSPSPKQAESASADSSSPGGCGGACACH